MNDSTDNPFDLPDIDQEDIPVLDDIVTLGSAHEDRTPIIPEQAVSGLADYNFDTDAAPTGDNSFTEEITSKDLSPEEIAGETPEEDANKLPLDQEQLTELIEQITHKVQNELESKIEALIQDSVRTQLIEQLPDIFNNTPPSQEN